MEPSKEPSEEPSVKRIRLGKGPSKGTIKKLAWLERLEKHADNANEIRGVVEEIRKTAPL